MDQPVNYLSNICEKCLSLWPPDEERPYLPYCPRCWNHTRPLTRAGIIIRFYLTPVKEPAPIPFPLYVPAFLLILLFILIDWLK